jgi:RNA polymerase sigma factor FliA
VSEITDRAILAALGRQKTSAVQRQTVAASNLANLDTPGCHAREATFEDALDLELNVSAPTRINPLHLGHAAVSANTTQEAEGLAAHREGNKVQLDRELLSMTRAAADTSPSSARRIRDACGNVRPDRLVITKVDEAKSHRRANGSGSCGTGRRALTHKNPDRQTMSVDADENLTERDQLVMQHVGLVKTLASRLASRLPSQVEISELISVGVIGLIDAAGRFKPSLGVPFDAFARRRIHGAMLDSLRDLDWAPRALRKLRREVDAVILRLRGELGREPESAEVAAAMNVPEAKYDRMLDQLRSVDLATIREASGDRDLLEMAIDSGEGPFATVHRQELRTHLAAAILQLPERGRQILALYYEQELTLAEIGQVIGLGESRISQLRTQALARLRSLLAHVVPQRGAN